MPKLLENYQDQTIMPDLAKQALISQLMIAQSLIKTIWLLKILYLALTYTNKEWIKCKISRVVLILSLLK